MKFPLCLGEGSGGVAAEGDVPPFGAITLCLLSVIPGELHLLSLFLSVTSTYLAKQVKAGKVLKEFVFPVYSCGTFDTRFLQRSLACPVQRGPGLHLGLPGDSGGMHHSRSLLAPFLSLSCTLCSPGESQLTKDLPLT